MERQKERHSQRQRHRRKHLSREIQGKAGSPIITEWPKFTLPGAKS